MRSSLGGDEDQGAGTPSVVRDRRRRARCVPDRPVNAGNPRSLTDTFTRLLTCAWTGPSIATYVLLSSRSRVRVAVGALIMLVNLNIRNYDRSIDVLLAGNHSI